MVSSGNTLKGLSKLCLRLSSDSHLLLHGKSFTDASLTNLRWRFYSLSSPHKLPSFKGSPPSRSFSSSSSSSEVGFLGWYLGKLGSNPLITKAITTSIIFAAADFTSQMITSASSGYDLKMFMGQAIFGPVSTTVFFSYNAALQGESGEEIVARLKRDLLPTLINGAMFWPICDFVTYKFVPVHLQPLMNSSCAYMWTIYLTYMASLKKASID
ncbi:protein sym-1-like isoform X2 [Durio zibethinus]|uniref:Protein sym-1-like isoform X2 n=1 Tax=Durio zibethinus TaxID=66656 RepID=A0A6P6B7N6_DURZI|nr:protein sym-1-like isoform X2 [Durio zibethinus]